MDHHFVTEWVGGAVRRTISSMRRRCGLRLLCWRARQRLCCCCACARGPGGEGGVGVTFADPLEDWELQASAGGSGQSSSGGTQADRLSSARRRYEHAIEQRTTHSSSSGGGGREAEVMMAQLNLAGVMDDVGEWVQARRMYEEVIEFRARELGPDHVATLDAQWYLAMMLTDDPRQWHRSWQLWCRVARGYRDAHGLAHANTAAASCCACCCCLCAPFSCCCCAHDDKHSGEGHVELIEMDKLSGIDDMLGGGTDTTGAPQHGATGLGVRP
jgi:hypothetical protein